MIERQSSKTRARWQGMKALKRLMGH